METLARTLILIRKYLCKAVYDKGILPSHLHLIVIAILWEKVAVLWKDGC